MRAEVGSDYSEKETLGKPERSAFVFITTESESSNLVLEDLRKIDEVKEVYLAHGAYDLIARLLANPLTIFGRLFNQESKT